MLAIVVGLTSFLGREHELATLVDLVAEHRLVTVTGPGGVGKTRLVTEAVPRLDRMFDGGTHVVAFGGVDPGADATTLSGQLDQGSPEAVAVSLGDVSALLVLDECEHIADAAAHFVARVLAASDTVSVVVTSREPLALMGEQLLVVAPLALPTPTDADPATTPAVALFFDRAFAGGTTWETTPGTVETVTELCRRIDGLPLAIELAAARARVLSPNELLDLMDDRLDVLGARSRERAGRHQSVRAAIAVSVNLLDDESRKVFARLGVFAGSFDGDIAHAVVGPRPDARLRTLDLLGGLVERSLVVAEPSSTVTRYRLLELVRAYAVDELRAAGEWDEVNERFVEVMLVDADAIVAQGIRRWSSEVITRIAAQVSHLITAIDWCIDRDPSPDRACRLFLPLFGAVHQARSGEVRAVAERMFGRWPDDRAPLRAEAEAIFATSLAISGESDRAAAAARSALADAANSSLGRVLAHRALVLAAIGSGDTTGAAVHAADGRTEAAALFPPFERELAAFEASLIDDTDEALALARRVATDSDVAHETITECWARLVAANVAARAGRWDDVLADLAHGRAAASSPETAWWVVDVFRSQALVRVYEATAVAFTDGWDTSRPLWHAALERAARRGELPEVATTLRTAAAVSGRLGRPRITALLARAVPETTELAVLPELFATDGERGEVVAVDAHDIAAPAVLSAALRAALDALAGLVPVDATVAPAPPVAEDLVDGYGAMRREGDTWAVTFRGSTARVRDLKGVRDLAVLLARPGHEVHCVEIMGVSDTGRGAGPALDEQARTEYRQRILELQAEIDESRTANDPARAERSETELDALVEQLSGAFGLGGRARDSTSTSERSRNAVTFRIRSAVKRIAEVHPTLGRHLTNAVRTGTWCSYQPEHETTWLVDSA